MNIEVPFSRTPGDAASAIPIYAISSAELDQPRPNRVSGTVDAIDWERWLRFARDTSFDARTGSFALVPDTSGSLEAVLVGYTSVTSFTADVDGQEIESLGLIASRLPSRLYRLGSGWRDPERGALAWALGSYRPPRFQCPIAEAEINSGCSPAVLWIGDNPDLSRAEIEADAVYFGRNLINAPANYMHPPALTSAAQELAQSLGGECRVYTGEDLLREYPLVSAVGGASEHAPAMIDLRFGSLDEDHITIVGKGVCFDTGGLDLKPSSNMRLMKKDMGGAAAALALARMMIGYRPETACRVLIPAVENSVDGRSMRPGDVLSCKNGQTIEVSNTDAEGRLILADAIIEAQSTNPGTIFVFATLTGAARVALGPEIASLFTPDDHLAERMLIASTHSGDPLWRMPLWEPYRKSLVSPIADIDNIGSLRFAGSITAALFLAHFFEKHQRWAHLDIFGWSPSSNSRGPAGGEVQAARAVFDLWCDERTFLEQSVKAARP